MDERLEAAIEALHMELVRYGLDAAQQGRILDHVVEVVRVTLDAAHRDVMELLKPKGA